MNFPEERIHLVEYSLIGLMLGWAIAGISQWPELWPLGWLWMVGLCDELIRAVLPNRVCDMHPDHIGGIFHLLPAMEVARVLDNGQPVSALPSCDLYRWYVEAVRSRANYGVLKKGDRLQWGPGHGWGAFRRPRT